VIVLDTHTWIWLGGAPDRLSPPAREAIRSADAIGVCAISCCEFAMLVAKGRLRINRAPLDWMSQSLNDPRIRLLPLTPAIAVKASQLGSPSLRDPVDRLIVATALLESAALVTKDDRIRAYPAVTTIW
jgi:PIN domain nuclease of toxin-antitoxin system